MDPHTRCVHWHLELDIIAIKFKCCDTYYACYECHPKTHDVVRWPLAELESTKVIYCGVCSTELTFAQYSSHGFRCVHCHSRFNPGCQLHYHLYFEMGRGGSCAPPAP